MSGRGWKRLSESEDERERSDRSSAPRSRFRARVPNWRPEDTIHLSHRTLRVLRVRDADQPPVLVVEDTSERTTNDRAA